MVPIVKPAQISSPRSISPPSLLPLPRSLRHNRSFAQLTRFLGITAHGNGSDTESDLDGDDGPSNDSVDGEADVDGDEEADIDEESLMWDAQAALIAHQPALAAKYYATASLPPYRSSAACLALGNLLARGSGLAQPESDVSPPQSVVEKSPVAQSPQVSWFSTLFRPAPSPPVSPSSVERRPSLITHGWALPTDGKRAVRDVEGMGKAGGWLILGIGWIIDAETAYAVKASPGPTSQPSRHNHVHEDIIVFDPKGKGRSETYAPPTASTSSSDESFDLPTPDDYDVAESSGQQIRLLYNLILPLLHLYRHGHIQHHDPVALPPLSSSQLPLVLRPQGDNEKSRNVWSLGSTVAAKVLELPLLSSTNLSKDESMKRNGIIIVCNYIRGITSIPEIAETSFKAILRCGPSGLEEPDDLIYQAYRRLNVVLKSTGGSPISPSELEAYPFPLLRPNTRTLRGRKPSASSLLSFADSMTPTSLRLRTPVKSTASLASLSYDPPSADPHEVAGVAGGAAVQSLYNLQRQQEKLRSAHQQKAKRPPTARAWWPYLKGWGLPAVPLPLPVLQQESSSVGSQDVSVVKDQDKTSLREVASSPELNRAPRRLPFEPTHAVAKIDPELAALELASALTKHVTCSVCNAGGVNFPNCRKCGLTFCSRSCRVDKKGAGDGKKHICGAWESRQQGKKSPSVAPTPLTQLATNTVH